MADQLFVNNVKTTLAADITSDSQTSIQVTSATGFPAPTGSQYFMIAIYDQLGGTMQEMVKCTAVSGVTCTVVRAQEGSTAQSSISAGAILIVAPPTKGSFETLQTAIAARLVAANDLSDLASAAAARGNLGLGSMATQDADDVSITGGSVAGITDLAVADGGTGASTAAAARSNLGLGSMATQAADSVAITGGSITGITDLAVADGGTGASTAAGARSNLGLGSMATAAQTISTSDPSGGSNGDVWFKVAS
jgi:hypothetical protein